MLRLNASPFSFFQSLDAEKLLNDCLTGSAEGCIDKRRSNNLSPKRCSNRGVDSETKRAEAVLLIISEITI